MKNDELKKYIDFLLSIALHKCGNLQDAQDLVQDTFLSALKNLADGKIITNYKAFLSTILNRRYYDMLRNKYKKPTVCYDDLSYISDKNYDFTEIYDSDEAKKLRHQIAFLSKIHREVIVRHYMNDESVKKIASDLNIPQGTVKSRLSGGRKQIKKGFIAMEDYTKQSYEPIILSISNSGRWGINGEPSSVVERDLIAQNLLYIAYNKPLTELELSKAVGIPSAYTEPIIKNLVDNELMKRTGNKVYTDFIIYTIADREKYIPAQKQLVNTNFLMFWKSINTGITKIKQLQFYSDFTIRQKQSIELFFAMQCLSNSIYTVFSKIYNTEQIMPNRPNGGKWIAMGFAWPQNYNYKEHLELCMYSYSGERCTYIENVLGVKALSLFVFETGFPEKVYYHGNFGIKNDDDMAKMLYIIQNNINPQDTAFNTELLKSIPWLTECGIFKKAKGKTVVDIPILSKEDFIQFNLIQKDTEKQLTDSIFYIFKEHLNDKKQGLPKHLKSVPLQKQYLPAMDSILMAVIYNAKEKGFILEKDADYDSVQCPRPMLLVVEK